MAGNVQGIKAGKAYVELYLEKSLLMRGMKEAEAAVLAFGEKLKGVGQSLMLVGGAITGPLLVGAKMFASTGDELTNLSKKTGVSVSALSELGYVAKVNGADLETLGAGMKGMAKVITDAGLGSASAAESLDHLNLAFSDLEKLSPEDRFTLIADRLGRITDETYRAAIAQKVFGGGQAGSSGIKLLPMADLGAAGINAGRQQARDYGLSWTKEDAAMASKLNNLFTTLVEVAKKLAINVGGALAPALTKAVQWMTNAAVGAAEFIKNNKEIIVTVAKIAGIVLGAGTALTGFGYAMIGISSAMKTLGSGLSIITSIIGALTSPLGIIIGAFGVATVSLVSYYSSLKDVGNGISNVFSESIKWVSTSNNVIAESMRFLGDSIKSSFDIASTTFTGIRDALKAGDIEAAFDIVVLGLKAAWEQFTYDFKVAWYAVQEVVLEAWFKTIDEIKTRFNELKLLEGEMQTNAGRKASEIYLKLTGKSNDPFAQMALDITTGQAKKRNEEGYLGKKDENDKERLQNDEALAALKAEHTNKLIEQDEKLAAAQQKLLDASTAASAAAKEAEQKQAALPDVSKLGGIDLMMKGKADSVFGTFNTMGGIRGQGLGSNSMMGPLNKIAEDTGNIRRMVDRVIGDLTSAYSSFG